MVSYTKDLWNNFYVNAVSEFIIYKFPEEAHLSSAEIMKKRHEEYMKNYPGNNLLYHIPIFDWDKSNH